MAVPKNAPFLGKKGEKPANIKRGTRNPDTWAEEGDWARVASSNVRAIKYSKEKSILYVEFLGGGIYGYKGVSASTAKQMFTATSMGRFVWKRLRDRYSFVKIE